MAIDNLHDRGCFPSERSLCSAGEETLQKHNCMKGTHFAQIPESIRLISVARCLACHLLKERLVERRGRKQTSIFGLSEGSRCDKTLAQHRWDGALLPVQPPRDSLVFSLTFRKREREDDGFLSAQSPLRGIVACCYRPQTLSASVHAEGSFAHVQYANVI